MVNSKNENIEINLKHPHDLHGAHNDYRSAPETEVVNVKADVLSEKHIEIFKIIAPEKEKQQNGKFKEPSQKKEQFHICKRRFFSNKVWNRKRYTQQTHIQKQTSDLTLNSHKQTRVFKRIETNC